MTLRAVAGGSGGGGDVTASSTTTFTNKTIDANGTGNSISNLETADFAANVIDTDGTLAANSDTRIATQKAVKTYAATAAQGTLADSALQADDIGVSVQGYDAVLAGTTASFTTTDETKLDYITATGAVDLDSIKTRVEDLDASVVLRGSWDASGGTFPGGGTAQAGSSYIVSVAGTVDSVAFALNDRIIAIADNASTTTFAANWFKADYTDQVLSVNGSTGAVTISTISGNAGTATALATTRAIYGNNFDGTAALTQVIASTYGGTGNGFTKFSGATSTEKTYTVLDATCTIPCSSTTGVTGADAVTNIMSLTQAEYNAIGAPNASTLYVIT